jgi:hypothetical protein
LDIMGSLYHLARTPATIRRIEKCHKDNRGRDRMIKK